ncbi:MAG TPA: hypothetical protein VK546_04690 [Gaiellales bacterium]|nr:hypothetical protein [Gaiellales bacterium]
MTLTLPATLRARRPGRGASRASDAGCSPELLALVRWTGNLGVVTAEAVAWRTGCSEASARARLQHGERAGVLARCRPLRGRASLFTATRHGLRVTGDSALEPGRVSAGTARHAFACASAAVALERLYPERTITGVPDLRRRERLAGRPLATAQIPRLGNGPVLLHRPDLVLWAAAEHDDGPIAVEVELSVKAPLRLAKICRAWARCREVSGVLYVAAPRVRAPLERAIAEAGGVGRIVVLDLDKLDRLRTAPAGASPSPPISQAVPSAS